MKHIATAVALLALSLPAYAAGGTTGQEKFMHALDEMMLAMIIESARDSKAIKDAYEPHLELLVLNEFAAVEEALYNGGLAPVPSESLRFNFTPRVSGAAPIGEKDILNQASYIAARPATLGALMVVASRVQSGPIEITSLVRHSEYQDALRKTNTNATTTVPMHTMGLAFDIALVNTPLDRAYEIRDVLREMRDAGDILFIGERQQLVFHVVPHPSRLGYFTDVYTRAVSVPAMGRDNVEYALPSVPSVGVAEVTSEIIDLLPEGAFAREWWDAAGAGQSDLVVEVSPTGSADPGPVKPAVPTNRYLPVAPFALLFGGSAGVFSYRRSRDRETVIKSLFSS